MIKRLFCSKLGLLLMRLFKVMWKIQFSLLVPLKKKRKKFLLSLFPLPACNAQFHSVSWDDKRWLWPPTCRRHGERCLSAQVIADALVFWKRHNKCAPSAPPSLVICLIAPEVNEMPLIEEQQWGTPKFMRALGPPPTRFFSQPVLWFAMGDDASPPTNVLRRGANDDVKPRSNQVV